MRKKTVDADYLLSVLKPEYSPNETSRRQREEIIMDHFQDFITSLEDEKVVGYAEAVAWKAELGEQHTYSSGTNESDQPEERYIII